ncbi:hypothetical protein [Mesorhizobium sp. ANAO-SY3R2]|uniref:hypothetical protein n=1 Tax=Mesorhizobium sp. ANAO-SY3R2 TaxID=3166644 RepID=UPI00366BF44E
MSSPSKLIPAARHCGKLRTAYGLFLSLLLAAPLPARAEDELQTSVSVLASIAGRIRVISENCRFPVDPMLEGRILEALGPLPEISMSDVVTLLVRSHQIELHARGRECHADQDAEHLKALKSIYQMSIANLKELVAARQAD